MTPVRIHAPAPGVADVVCPSCGAYHEIGTFDGAARVVVVGIPPTALTYAQIGDFGTVIDWRWWAGNPEWVRVELDRRDRYGDRVRVNFHPCQLARTDH